MKNNIFHDFSNFFPGFVLLFCLIIFGSNELYFSNISEFWFAYSDFMPVLFIVFIVGVILIGIFLSIIPSKISIYIKAFIYALAFAYYIQGNFLPNDYGSLNGELIDWNAYSHRLVYNTIIWLLIVLLFLLLTYFFKKKALSVMNYLGMLLVLMQILSLGMITFISLNNNKENLNNRYLSREGEFNISNKENTIVIVLDCFDAEVMYQLTQNNSELINSVFEDFTFYRNTVGGATRTKYAVPYMLTGKTNTEENSYLEYLAKEYNKSPLFQELRHGDYDSRFYLPDTYIDLNQVDAIDNLTNGKPSVTSKFGLAKRFAKLVAFRYSPHIFKKYFWMYSEDFDVYKSTSESDSPYVIDDVGFYQELLTGLKANISESCFRYYHLSGAHPPYTMNSKCERVNYQDSSEIEQAIGSIMIVNEYVKQLKSLNLYNEATIIVMSDHGGSRGIEQNPLFIVKDSKDKHPFSISNSPLSYTSFSEYLSNVLKNKNTKISDYITNDTRYFYYDDGELSIVNITEYACDPGIMAWQNENIYKTGVVYHGDSLNISYEYKLGTPLSFAEEATANPYEKMGYSRNEGSFTWTRGEESELYFEITDKDYNNLELILSYAAYNDFQNIIIFANNHLVADYIALPSEDKKIIIPKEYVEDSKLTIHFYYPGALSPREVNGSTDTRLLSLRMIGMTINNTDEQFIAEEQILSYKYDYGTVLDFTNKQNGNKYIKAGFSQGEGNYTATECKNAKLFFEFDDNNFNELLLSIHHDIFVAPQHIVVYVNDVLISDYVSEGDTQKTIVIPKDAIEDRYLMLKFEMPDAFSAKEYYGTDDNRRLSMKLFELSIDKNE